MPSGLNQRTTTTEVIQQNKQQTQYINEEMIMKNEYRDLN